MKTLLNLLSIILKFTTGLGFYGIGLLGVSFAFYFLLHGQLWTNLGTGLLGAFIFKNYEAIYSYIKKIKK